VAVGYPVAAEYPVAVYLIKVMNSLLYLLQLYCFILYSYSKYFEKRLDFLFIILLNTISSTEQSFREADSH
jgi:hypothetical protein